MTRWLLGDQLDASTPTDERVLLIESRAFAARRPYHPAKLTLLFAAMRHHRDRLRDADHDVVYLRAERFGDALDDYFETHPGETLTLRRPASHGAADRLADLVADRGGDLRVVPNDGFLTTPREFDEWAAGRDGLRHEDWYRHVRRETGYLMDGDDPVGGAWNYDEANRETPPDGWAAPPVPEFEYGSLTRDTHEWVVERFGDHWGATDFDAFRWPVTRGQAERALDHFVDHRLPEFGPYQDAMLDDEWALAHSLLSTSLNLGLLGPAETVEAAIGAYEDGSAPIESVEGFVRQVVGWREFVRHVYRRRMPAMTDGDRLDRERSLPPLYYDRDTEMRCLERAVGRVHERGYAHHVERLMLLSNFATLYGADPHRLNDWFHHGFVDAHHWVTTPNVVAMGSFATDALSSKPYVASANYVDRMSDHCAACSFDPDATTGDDACPFNALYWSFLDDNEDDLRGTGRMGLVYSHLDDRSDAELAAIHERARTLRERAAAGEL